MKGFWTLGVCLVLALVSGLITGTAASAAEGPPEYGRCVQKGTTGGAGYANATCTKARTAKAKYDWLAGPGPKPGFTWQERPTYTPKYHYCLRALGEEQVAKEDREKAAGASEPEKAELEAKAQEAELRSEQEYKLAGSPGEKYTRAQCEALIEAEEAKAPAGLTTVPTGSGMHKSSKLRVSCGAVAAAGEFTASKTVGGVTITFKECATKATTCQSTANPGEIVTSPLEGELGVVAIAHGKPKAGLSLAAALPGAAFAEFTCGGESIVITGSVITGVEGNQMAKVEVVSYGGSDGLQTYEKFLEGPLDVLETSIDGAPAEQTALRVKALQENDEAIEVNNDV